jgi:hypothetical protein
MIESVERCEPIIASSETKSPIRLHFTKEELIIKCIASTGQIVDSLPIPFSGEETEIGFNHKYFGEALKACEEDLVKIELKIPSIEEQNQIVEKLDAFENLIQSLEQEIKLRKQQYEYYREKLLTFEKE